MVKLNSILRYVHDSAKEDKINKALTLVEKLYNLREQKVLTSDKSLYTPRGFYVRDHNQYLDDLDVDFDLDPDFMKQFKNSYNEEKIKEFFNLNKVNGIFRASTVLGYECDKNRLLMTIFSLIYGAENNFELKIEDEYVTTRNYRIKNFEVKEK